MTPYVDNFNVDFEQTLSDCSGIFIYFIKNSPIVDVVPLSSKYASDFDDSKHAVTLCNIPRSHWT